MLKEKIINTEKRALWLGALAWILFSIIVILLRGIRWDEHYEFAQVVVKLVNYPDDHPLFRCTRSSLNIQVYTSAFLIWLNSDPAFLNGFRNILYMVATTLPMYFLASRISGRPVFGHLAVLLTLLGLHEAFDAAYRMNAYPFYSSTGHIGRAYALFTLSVLLSRSWKSGLFLIGIMPVVHIGQMPILFWWTIFFVAASWFTEERKNIIRSLPWGILAITICGLVWMSRAMVNVEAPVDGPYYSNTDAHSLWIAYLAQHDIHRTLPGNLVSYTNSFLIMGASLLLIGAASRLEWRAKPSRYIWSWLFVYILICAGSVWGIMGINYIIGEDIPYILIAWMPYRFTNHTALLLLAALPCLLLHSKQDTAPKSIGSGSILLCCALLFGLLGPALQWILPLDIYGAYFKMSDGMMFVLCGAVFSMIHRRLHGDNTFRAVWSILSILGYSAMIAHHQFGAAAAATGFLIDRIVHIAQSNGKLDRVTMISAVTLKSASTILMISFVAFQLYRQWEPEHNNFEMSELDIQVTDYLLEAGDNDAVLLARPDQYTLQARTNHPVLMDVLLVGWISYMPSLAPSIDKMQDDIYGMGLLESDGRTWDDIWRNRSTEDWQALADEYDVRYVLSPEGVPLQLEELFTAANPWGNVETFYRIQGAKSNDPL